MSSSTVLVKRLGEDHGPTVQGWWKTPGNDFEVRASKF